MARKAVLLRKPREGLMAREAMASGRLMNALDEQGVSRLERRRKYERTGNVIQNQ
jgi:uncharacterized Zn finger protein